MLSFLSFFLFFFVPVFLSLTHFLSLSFSYPLLFYSAFPSPLKVKCIREETSPGRGGSDPPRAAPRETRVCGCSRMLRERESGTSRMIFRLAKYDREEILESGDCISFFLLKNGFSSGEIALLSQLLRTKHMYLRHVLRPVILHFPDDKLLLKRDD